MEQNGVYERMEQINHKCVACPNEVIWTCQRAHRHACVHAA